MNKFLLYLVMLPSFLWRSMGADTMQLKAILGLKLTLDDRKPVAFGRQQNKNRKMKYGSLLNTFIFLIMGGMYMLPLTVIEDRIFSLTFFFSMLLAIITFMLITDFSSVLFDSRDKYILFPRPVNDRTIVLSRMLHIFIYLVRVVIPLALPGWIVLGAMDGWKSACLFILPLLLLVFFILFLVNGFYLLVLRLAKPEKFKDVINYFQVFTSIIFFASVYLLPRMFDRKNPHDFNILAYSWVRFSPTYWLASCWSWIGFPVSLQGTAPCSILAIVVPLACMYLLVKFLSPQFSRRIAGIDAMDSGGYNPLVNGVRRKAPGRLYQKLAYTFNSSDDARAGFMIAWLQSSRSRTFRMRVYPSFAFIPIYFVYILTMDHEPLSEVFHRLPDKPVHLFLLYFSSFVMISACTYLTMSDQYKAAWVYYAAPVAVPGRIMIGAFKALWVKFFLPFFAVLSIFVIYVWGTSALWDVILSMVNATLFTGAMARINLKHLPFSIVEQTKQGAGRVLKSLLSMCFIGILGFGHFMCIHLLWLKLLFLLLSCLLLWLIWTSYAETSWENMISGEEH